MKDLDTTNASINAMKIEVLQTDGGCVQASALVVVGTLLVPAVYIGHECSFRDHCG